VRRPSDDVTETELAMLRVLWDRGEATRRQVTDALYPDGGEAHYSTRGGGMEGGSPVPTRWEDLPESGQAGWEQADGGGEFEIHHRIIEG
jgi:hypothetical protein